MVWAENRSSTAHWNRPLTITTEITMRKLLFADLLAAPIIFNPAFAATEQQNKMTACNKEATGKKGDERKKFMSDCLKKG
jgi:hypothetical protein